MRALLEDLNISSNYASLISKIIDETLENKFFIDKTIKIKRVENDSIIKKPFGFGHEKLKKSIGKGKVKKW